MRSLRLLVVLPAMALLLASCAEPGEEEVAIERAASVVPIPGTDRVRVRLVPDAVRRLDIRTDSVRDALIAPRPTVAVVVAATSSAGAAPGVVITPELDTAKGKGPTTTAPPPPPTTAPPAPPTTPPPLPRRVIPFAAVLYAPSGGAYTYVALESGLYERTPIVVDYVVNDIAALGEPLLPVGTSVVTVGGPELSGIELGVGE